MVDFIKIKVRVSRTTGTLEQKLEGVGNGLVCAGKLAELNSSLLSHGRTLYQLPNDPEGLLKITVTEAGNATIQGSLRQWWLGECSPKDLTKSEFEAALAYLDKYLGGLNFLTHSKITQLEIGWQFELSNPNELIKNTLKFHGFSEGVTIEYDGSYARRGNTNTFFKLYNRTLYTAQKIRDRRTKRAKCCGYPANQLRAEIRFRGSSVRERLHVRTPTELLDNWEPVGEYVAGRLAKTEFKDAYEVSLPRRKFDGDVNDAGYVALATTMPLDSFKEVLKALGLPQYTVDRAAKKYREAIVNLQSLVAPLVQEFRRGLEAVLTHS